MASSPLLEKDIFHLQIRPLEEKDNKRHKGSAYTGNRLPKMLNVQGSMPQFFI
jgi:hypothetical protein